MTKSKTAKETAKILLKSIALNMLIILAICIPLTFGVLLINGYEIEEWSINVPGGCFIIAYMIVNLFHIMRGIIVNDINELLTEKSKK